MKILSGLTTLLLISSFAQARTGEGGALMKTPEEAVGQEALVSITEAKAIEALLRIIEKRKGTPEEPDLLERLSELYLKQAKSARFFGLTKTSENTLKFLPPIISSKSSQKPLAKAMAAFDTIQRKYPKYTHMDRVHFHAALTSAQMGRFNLAIGEVEQLLKKYPKSEWVPDGHLLVGEIFYDQQKFQTANKHFVLAAASKKEKVSHYARYKQAWSEYNQDQNTNAIETLKSLVKDLDPNKAPSGFALRNESIRDLALFLTESPEGKAAFEFFSNFTTEQETADALLKMAQIFKSHSKFKEAESVGDIYFRKSKFDAGKIQFHLLFASINSDLKKGEKQIEHIKEAAKLCSIQGTPVEACGESLSQQVTQAAEQWWKEWQKSKSKTSVSLARRALEIEIQRNANPKRQTLEAYAELLFQSEDFETAATVYGELYSTEKELVKAETFAYGRLVSLDRLMVKDPSKILPREDFKKFAGEFTTKFTKSIHAAELQLKWARLEVEDHDPAKGEKILTDLLKRKLKPETQVAAQNLMIEALQKNSKSKELRALVKDWTEQASGERKNELRRLKAKLALEDLENATEADTAKALAAHMDFFKKYESDKAVSDPVLWKTLSLSLIERNHSLTLELAQKASDRHPKDPRSWDAVKTVLVQLNESPKANMKPEELKILGRGYEAALKLVPANDRSGVLWSYREYLQLKKQDASKVEEEILKLNVEPESSLIRVARLETRLQKGDLKGVFEESKKFVSAKAPAPVRARARLLQARVLEAEFKAQSVKTSLSRLQTVVAMKLEKLSKAQEAFVAAAQLSPETKISEDAKMGLRRIFEHAIESLKQIQIKDQLTADERKALDTEIQALVLPLEKQLQQLGPISRTAESDVQL